MVVIDSDVLMLAYSFHQDNRQPSNHDFLGSVQSQTPLFTIYSVMEVLGQLCFNLSPKRLAEWPLWLQNRYNLTILYPDTNNQTATDFFQNELINHPSALMQKQRIPYLDSLILRLAEQTTGVRIFVTWNARHYRGKTELNVLTPIEYMAL